MDNQSINNASNKNLRWSLRKNYTEKESDL